MAESGLTPGLKLNAASGLAWKYCQINDRRNCERMFGNAQAAFDQLPASLSADNRDYATVEFLEAKGEVMRVRGDADARVTALRDATVVSRRNLERSAHVNGADAKNAVYRAAINPRRLQRGGNWSMRWSDRAGPPKPWPSRRTGSGARD